MQGFDLDGRISQPEEGILNIDVLMVSNMNFFNCKTMPQSNVFTKRKNNFLVLALWDTLRFSPFVYDKREKQSGLELKKNQHVCQVSRMWICLSFFWIHYLFNKDWAQLYLITTLNASKNFLIWFVFFGAVQVPYIWIHYYHLKRVHKILIFQAFFLWELRWCLKKVKRLGWFSYLQDTFFKSLKPLRKFSIYLHSAKVHSAS